MRAYSYIINDLETFSAAAKVMRENEGRHRRLLTCADVS
jgi:hypothetical protein